MRPPLRCGRTQSIANVTERSCGLELRTAAETDRLELVARLAAGDERGHAVLLQERVRIVEAQRSERRVPQDAGANRGANVHVVVRRRDRLAGEQSLQLELVR